MIIPPKHDPQHRKIAIKNAQSLKPLDFAFILRSGGTWTYAIVADRPFTQDGPSIRFVLDGKGSTKTIRKKYWGRGIRLVNTALVNVGGSHKNEGETTDDDTGTEPFSESESSVFKVRNSIYQEEDDVERHLHRVHVSRTSLNSDTAVIGQNLPEGSKVSVIHTNPPTENDESKMIFAKSCSTESFPTLRAAKGRGQSKISKKIKKRFIESTISVSMTSGRSDAAVIAPGFSPEKNVNNHFDSAKKSHATIDESDRSGSTVSDGAVISSVQAPEKRKDEDSVSVPLEEEAVEKLIQTLVDESERSGGSLGSNLKAILSLEYLGMLDPIDDEPKENKDARCLQHHKSSPKNKEKGARKKSKKHSSKKKAETSVVDCDWYLNKSSMSFHNSVHTVAWEAEMAHHSKDNKKDPCKRRSSHSNVSTIPLDDAIPQLDKAIKKKKSSSRRRASCSSANSVASDISNFSALLREIYYSPDNLGRFEDANSKTKMARRHSLSSLSSQHSFRTEMAK